jgi:hypothetical protein
MFRISTFLALMLLSALAFAQTPPPGVPYDPDRHPNPIITFVDVKEFRPADYAKANDDAGIELLGLSNDEGTRESLATAAGKMVKNMPIISGVRTDVTFYPVVRQKFRLAGGADLTLYSFKFPKVALPKDFGQMVLNEATNEKKKKPAEMRFGGKAPETLEIRGTDGLLFEENNTTTIYWEEDGVGHTATALLPRRELFRIVENLL